jgi:hypothetical protein
MREVLIPPTLAYFAGVPTVNFLLPNAGSQRRSGSAISAARSSLPGAEPLAGEGSLYVWSDRLA